MKTGGMMAYAFKIFLGNPDIAVTLITWGLLLTIVFTVIKLRTDD